MHPSYLMNQFLVVRHAIKPFSHIAMMLANVRLVKDTSSSYPENVAWRRG